MTQSQLKSHLHYNPSTGVFTRLDTNRPSRLNKPTGNIATHGYVRIGIKDKSFYAHRLAFLYMTGKVPKEVDHLDHDRTNNKWSNLREADRTMQMRNTKLSKNNASGHHGVDYVSVNKNKWVARIMVDYKSIHLGSFKHKEDAIKARKHAEKLYGFSANHGV